MLVSLVTSMLMAAFTTTDSVWRYYYMIWFVLSYAVALLVGRLMSRGEKRLIVIGTEIIVLLYATFIWRAELLPVLQSDNINETYAEVVSWMQENDYYYGYSTYETSNAMTGYCNGEVQISAVADLGQMDICKWLTDRTWYGPYVAEDTPTAYIIPTSRREEFSPMLDRYTDLALSWESDVYLIYTSAHNYTWQ